MEIQRVSAGQCSRQWLILLLLQPGRDPAPQRASKTVSRDPAEQRQYHRGVIPLGFFPLPVLIDEAGSRAQLIISPSPLHPPP